MKFSKVAISTGIAATLMFTSGVIAHADTPTQSTHDVALKVIDGTYGNGTDRVKQLKSNGFDAAVIQKEVNRILTGEASTSSTATTSETQPTKTESTTATKATSSTSAVTTNSTNNDGLDMGQTSGQVNIQALANYMVSNTANTAGYTASEWAYIITHESEGQVDSVNASSGAYGAFQLLGHGEYAGMPLSAQIAMASQLPAGSWVVYN